MRCKTENGTEMEYQIGDRVSFTREMEMALIPDGHTWAAKGPFEPRFGIFIGYRHKQHGVVKDGGIKIVGYYPGEPEYEPAYFHETGPRILVALVVENERRNPVIVDPSSLRHVPVVRWIQERGF